MRVLFRQRIQYILSVLMLIFAFSPAPLYAFSAGSGTQGDPYQISSCQDFQDINDNLNAYYALMADLDCSYVGKDIMVGTDTDPFTGNLEGNNHTITVDISIVDGTLTANNAIGLFRLIENGELNNLTVAGSLAVNVTGGASGVGVLAGKVINSDDSNITMSNLHADATLISYQELFVGGVLFGQIDSNDDGKYQLDTLSSSGSITVQGSDYAEIGGLIGDIYDYSVIDNSYSTAAVTAPTTLGSRAGGFAGSIDERSEVTDSFATGDVVGNEEVGGFVGEHDDYAVIERSYATGDATGYGYVGGFVGDVDDWAVIRRSAAVGTVTGNPNLSSVSNKLGGFAGQVWYSTRIFESYATGDVISADGNGVGGFIGVLRSRGSVLNAYARGNVSGDTDCGGFIGRLETDSSTANTYSTGTVTCNNNFGGYLGHLTDSKAVIENSYWDTQTSGQPVSMAGGVGKTTAQLKAQNTFPVPAVTLHSHDQTTARYVRILVHERRDLQTAVVNLAEFALRDGANNISWPVGTTVKDAGGNDIGTNILDNNITTASSTAAYDGNFEPIMPVEYIIDTGSGNSVTFDNYRFATTRDKVNQDPFSWEIQVRDNENDEWTTIDEATDVTLPFERTAYSDTPANGWDYTNVWGLDIDINDAYPHFIYAPTVIAYDNDGVSPEEEDAAPNNGDANNDGSPDSEQANVTSFVNTLTGKYLTVVTACDSNFNVQNGGESSGDKDVAFDYPAGLVSFVGLGCGSPGVSVSVTLYHYGDLNGASLVARKWSGDNVYSTISNATVANTTIGGSTAVSTTYQILDGGELDQDGEANGEIVDPVGLGVQVLGSPNTGL